MLSDEYFYNLSRPLLGQTEDFVLRLMQRIKSVSQKLIQDPEASINPDQITRQTLRDWEQWNSEARGWTDDNLAKAYKKGITQVNTEADGEPNDGAFREQLLVNTSSGNAGASLESVLLAAGGSGGISNTAKEILDEYPRHLTMYEVFQAEAYSDFGQSRLPVVRDVQDKVRQLIVQASDAEYVDADTLTRRELSQSIMDRLADDNITGIRYNDGRIVNLDSYAEMVARTQTGNAARQAHMNRLQEYGMDLVVISQHFPCSDLCIDWQGRVYSLSGSSANYPPLSDAIAGGLYHVNCKHSQSGYTPGQRTPDPEIGKRENMKRYEITQKQRYNERQIRAWKRRKAAALSEDAERKAQSYISKWQARQRDLIDDNGFLKRKYAREQVS